MIVKISWIFKLFVINAAAFAFYPFIVIKKKEYINNKIMINHEMIHLKQQKELFVLMFYVLYFYYFMKNWVLTRNTKKAYFLIPFELEAYTYQSKPEDRKKFGWFEYRKFNIENLKLIPDVNSYL